MKEKQRGLIVLFILLSVFWLVIASSYDLVDMIIGGIAAVLIVFYSLDMVFTKKELTGFSLKAFFVTAWVLLKGIVISNIEVAKIVLSKKMPIDPGFKKIRQPLKKPLTQTMYGNAITLTPGTLTVDMTETYIIVHGLQKKTLDSLEGNEIERAFIKLEGDK